MAQSPTDPAPTGANANPAGATPTGAAGRPRPAKPAPKPTARTALPPATPGPTITRPGTADTRLAGPGGSQGGSGANRPAGAAARPPAALPAPPRNPVRSTPKRLQEAHATAARRLQMPELAITNEEAAEIQAAFDSVGELTGWQPSGPLWSWLGIMWTFGMIYGGKFLDVRARTMAEAAEAAARLPAPARAMAPVDHGGTGLPAGLAPAPAPAGPVAQPTIARTPSPAAPSPPPAAQPLRPAPVPMEPIDLERLLSQGGIETGETVRIPGVPHSTAAERMDQF